MERFDVRSDYYSNAGWRLTKREDGQGAFCYADDAIRSQRRLRAVSILLVIVCALLSGYLVYEKYTPKPVSKTISEEQYEQVTNELRRANAKAAVLERKVADHQARRAMYERMVKTLNGNLKIRDQQLAALKASVPPQEVVAKEIRREASTHAGIDAIALRDFGLAPGKVKVIP